MLKTPLPPLRNGVAARAASNVARSSSARQARSGRFSMRRFKPLKTLPGPHSMSCAWPLAARARTVSCQRTGAHQLAHQQLTDVIRLLVGDGIDGADIADDGSDQLHTAQPPCQLLGGWCHQAAMRRHTHRQGQGALGPCRLAPPPWPGRRPPAHRRSPPGPGH